MAFRLAGRNPLVEGLIHRPGDRSELQTLELRPGMDGFSGPPTLETIGPYNPSEDESEFIQLAENAPPGSYRVPEWEPSGYKGDPSLTPLEYDRTAPSWDINGPKLTEPIPNYTPQRPEPVIASSGSSLVSGPAPQSEFDRLLMIDPRAAYKHVQKDIAELQAAGARAQVVADLVYPRGPSPVFAGQNPAVGALIKDMFKPFDIVKNEGGSPYEPYKIPRPDIPQPTPKAMKNGLNEKIANLVAALRSNG